MTDHQLSTRLVHAGESRIDGAAVPPIFQTTVFEQQVPEPGYDDIRYPRLSNTPNHRILGAKLADLEGAERAFVTSSGMAAITATLLQVLRDGGHLLVQGCLYGGTHALVHQQLAAFGISFDVIDADRPESWAALVRPSTRAIYVETLTNPLLQVIDHEAVVAFARERGLVSIVDNTFATPVNFAAVRFGYDVALHSATKYLNGHSDLCAGAVCGSETLVGGIQKLANLLGGNLEAIGCFLLHRGLRTLELRVRRQNDTGQRLAAALAALPAVARVHHPSLPTHPHHERAARLLGGHGGMLSFELRGGERAVLAMLAALELPIYAPSLGGPETLLTRPAKTSHASLRPEERAALGIEDGLVRVSVGLEDAGDLRDDFVRAIGTTG